MPRGRRSSQIGDIWFLAPFDPRDEFNSGIRYNYYRSEALSGFTSLALGVINFPFGNIASMRLDHVSKASWQPEIWCES